MNKPKIKDKHKILDDLEISDAVWNLFLEKKFCENCESRGKDCIDFELIFNYSCEDCYLEFIDEWKNKKEILSKESSLFIVSEYCNDYKSEFYGEVQFISKIFEINGSNYTAVAIGENLEEGGRDNPYLWIVVYKNNKRYV